MSEPWQAESAPWWPHFVTFCERDCSPGARSSAFYQRIYADAWAAAYLAGQLAMREQVAKQARELFERTYVFGCSIDGPATDNLDDAERRLAELVRALSPEEHRTVTVNQERNESHG